MFTLLQAIVIVLDIAFIGIILWFQWNSKDKVSKIGFFGMAALMIANMAFVFSA